MQLLFQEIYSVKISRMRKSVCQSDKLDATILSDLRVDYPVKIQSTLPEPLSQLLSLMHCAIPARTQYTASARSAKSQHNRPVASLHRSISGSIGTTPHPNSSQSTMCPSRRLSKSLTDKPAASIRRTRRWGLVNSNFMNWAV